VLNGGAVVAIVRTPVEIDEETLATAAEVASVTGQPVKLVTSVSG
jgi:hypothetical protein